MAASDSLWILHLCEQIAFTTSFLTVNHLFIYSFFTSVHLSVCLIVRLSYFVYLINKYLVGSPSIHLSVCLYATVILFTQSTNTLWASHLSICLSICVCHRFFYQLTNNL